MSCNSTFKETVKSEWIDYNGHMNVAYYVLVFDHATDFFLEQQGIDASYRREEGKSLFVVESHVNYANEVSEDEPLIVKTYCVGVDRKRLHLFHEMYREGHDDLCASNEVMLVHVDMNLRKSVEFGPILSEKLRAETNKYSLENSVTKLGSKIRSLSN